MILSHLLGLLSHPIQEWESIRDEARSISECYRTHVLILAAIPPVSAFIGATQVGWAGGSGEIARLTTMSGVQIMIAFYLAMLVAVFVMGKAIHWMAITYGSESVDLDKCVVLSAYTATPLFLVGIVALYPVVWLNLLFGLGALAYTIYLLYTGVPIVMQISKEQGFLFSTAVLTVGMVTLVGMLAVTALLWGFGIAPSFTS